MIKTLVVMLALCGFVMAQEIPENFPRFVVPGHERQMDRMRELFWKHYKNAGPLIPLWDEWMPNATLWPAMENDMSGRWAAALAARPMNAEGYILTMQHDGPGHAEGWPFPGWHNSGGVGWHFRGTGIPGYDLPTVGAEGWVIVGGRIGDVNDKGLIVALTEPRATLSHGGFTIEAKNSPWLRLNWWATGLERANCYVEWTTKENPEYSAERRAYFSPAAGSDTHIGETRTMMPLYRIPTWSGTITSFRIAFDNPAPAKVIIKSFHTAPDTRQTVNNLNFIRGCHDYFLWSGDNAFLRGQIGRIRTAMRYMQREFQTREKKCLYTTWPGHEGRSGVRWIEGKKQIVPGEGIGSNYWDILPFGGEDALGTIYYYDSVQKLAELEEVIAAHPQWCIAGGADAFDPANLRKHADEVREYGRKRFWNEKTGRFGTVDLDGVMHDYGFTFLNNEAIYFDFASPEQAKSIRDWIGGRRKVECDTSQAADIYHWRFGPRSTTLRNLDYYYWGWSGPEAIPFGAQVQDGGAVLGWSYHDLMAILRVEGPDACAARLNEITEWFGETQTEGGYRAYYTKDPSRGTMQGANVAGGLGLDKEFFESVLVPQVMIYGFLGLRATPEGFSIHPRLPGDWENLKITRIAWHGHVFEISASHSEVEVSGGPVVVDGPQGVSVKIR